MGHTHDLYRMSYMVSCLRLGSSLQALARVQNVGSQVPPPTRSGPLAVSTAVVPGSTAEPPRRVRKGASGGYPFALLVAERICCLERGLIHPFSQPN